MGLLWAVEGRVFVDRVGACSMAVGIRRRGLTISVNDNDLYILTAPYIITLVRGTTTTLTSGILSGSRLAAMNAVVSVRRADPAPLNTRIATATILGDISNEVFGFRIFTRSGGNRVTENARAEMDMGSRGFRVGTSDGFSRWMRVLSI